ncbi:competence protein [Rhodococcoides trifolii]|uniref:Competence protein n=2 Tax=Rhodococcoides trifolii TaxID=908250 RepID=A0A917FWM2_9NOCA|nr:CinA family protein [Rhodococcus trifolii]GGG07981.1 competence protein [Rhodococcus trifolii]
MDPLADLGPVRELVGALASRGQTVATAESLTAGLLSATLGGVPGVSAVLRGGLVVYATDLKASLAGVSDDVLGRDGPVAESTAGELAVGAAARCAATWGVGLTGVAGPDTQDGHRAGTVFLGFHGPDGTDVVKLQLTGDRWFVRSHAVREAVSHLLDRVTRTDTG